MEKLSDNPQRQSTTNICDTTTDTQQAGTNDNHRQRHLTIYGQPLTTYNKLQMKDTTANQHQQLTTNKG
jgi:hypothetical protein